MNNLRKLRESKKLSLRELGKELNMNASVLGNYERGDRNPKTEVWEKIARYFDVSVPYIMGLTDDFEESTRKIADELDNRIEEIGNPFKDIKNHNLSPEQKENIDTLDELSEDFKKEVLNSDIDLIDEVIQAYISNYFSIAKILNKKDIKDAELYNDLLFTVGNIIGFDFVVDINRYFEETKIRDKKIKEEYGNLSELKKEIGHTGIQRLKDEQPISHYLKKEDVVIKEYLEMKNKISEIIDKIFLARFNEVYDRKDDDFYKLN